MTGPASNLYESWQEQIQRELNARVRTHQHEVRQAKVQQARQTGAPAPLVLIGEGDS